MTEQRRVIARVLEGSADHPDVEELYRRASAVDSGISISTVYRTVKLFEDAGIIERHDFRDGRSRYETVPDEHHDHLIDLRSGKVIEFRSEVIEKLQQEVARELGYELVDHRLELYAIPIPPSDGTESSCLKVPVSFFFEDAPGTPDEGMGFGETKPTSYVVDFLSSSEGLSLNKAFVRIREPKVRKRIVDLVRTLAGEEE